MEERPRGREGLVKRVRQKWESGEKAREETDRERTRGNVFKSEREAVERGEGEGRDRPRGREGRVKRVRQKWE